MLCEVHRFVFRLTEDKAVVGCMEFALTFNAKTKIYGIERLQSKPRGYTHVRIYIVKCTA